MLRFLVLLILIVPLPGNALLSAEPGERQRAFLKALELFDNAKVPADYRAAAAELESILDDGFRNGAVYYNLGNAYYRAAEFGRAILNYRKAKPYRPNDPYLTANLQQALAMAPGRLPESPRPLWTHVLFWTDWLAFPTKVPLMGWGMILAAGVTILAMVFRRPRLYFIPAALGVLSLGMALDVYLSRPMISGSKLAIITGETIARKGTGTSYEPAFDQPLKDGAEFQILNETPDWTFGHFEGIGDGWVRNEFVAR